MQLARLPILCRDSFQLPTHFDMDVQPVTDGLTPQQQAAYDEQGFVIVENLMSDAECDRFVDHMVALLEGSKELDGFAPRTIGERGRTHNQHTYDFLALEYLLLPQLQAPLRDCLGGDEAEGIQTMYFWEGSEQRRHQDQYYLPTCISAWLAFMDVDENNGTIFVQPGSHKNRLLTQADFQEGGEFEGWEYNDAVDEQAKRNALLEVPVQVSKGSVVFFDGVLVHRGGPILQEGSDRHVLANHYIPYGFDDWPHRSWTRHAFDGRVRRHPEPTD